MIKVLRKHRNWLMIVIAILALPFCIYFVKSDPSLIRADAFAQMYGRKVTVTEAQRDARLLQLADFLGISDLREDLAPGNGTDNQKAAEFVINLIVLRHEVERLGIEPAESDIVEAVRNFPAFHGASGFDSAKYDQVERMILPSLGFTDEQLRELAHDQLCLKRIKQVVASGVSLPESESKSNYEQLYGKNFVSIVRVRSADFLKEIKPTDDDIKKYYEAHKGELKTDEKRKVEFVRLALSEEQKKLKDKERIEARPLTLDEAKQKIVDQIKNERGREMALAQGRKAVETLRNGLKAGQPLQFTLEQAGGLKAEKLEPFTVADEGEAKNPPEKPKDQPADLMMIKNVAAQLQPGEVSDFVPWVDGGLIVLMDKREQPDPAKYQQTKATFEERYLKNARDYVFAEWLYDRQRAAGLRPTKG